MDNPHENQDNIFTMTDPQHHREYAPLSLVQSYWMASRKGREMPRRADIDPRGIETALEFAFILERVSAGVTRMRVAGSHLHDILGMETRGMALSRLFEDDERLRVARLVEQICQTPATAEVEMCAEATSGLPKQEARMVLLPLTSDLGDVSRILGCLIAPGHVGPTPRKFGIRDVALVPLEMSEDAKPREPDLPPMLRGLAERREQFIGAQRKADKTISAPIGEASTNPKRPHYLRLVATND